MECFVLHKRMEQHHIDTCPCNKQGQYMWIIAEMHSLAKLAASGNVPAQCLYGKPLIAS